MQPPDRRPGGRFAIVSDQGQDAPAVRLARIVPKLDRFFGSGEYATWAAPKAG